MIPDADPMVHRALVLDAWGFGPGATVTPIEVGLINRTYRVDEGARRVIVQRVNPIFEPAVNLDIDAITRHLAARGEVTPRLVPTTDGRAWITDPEGRWWRALTFLEGRVAGAMAGPAMAQAAGALVGRFHAALATLSHRFHFTRPGIHDTPRHLRYLEDTLAALPGHPAYDTVAPLADAILAHARALPPVLPAPPRIAHGDLKITNVLFDDGLTRAVALLDLDTLAHMPLALELGDAFRSWCNPAGEASPDARFDPALYRAALTGYAAAGRAFATPAERDSLVAGAETIALELAARFCADALRESYFGWDPARYASRGEHNRARARAQLAVARSVAAQRDALAAITREAFA